MVNELTDSEATFHIGQWNAAFAAFGALGFAKLGQVLQVGEAFLESHEFFVRQNSELFLGVALLDLCFQCGVGCGFIEVSRRGGNDETHVLSSGLFVIRICAAGALAALFEFLFAPAGTWIVAPDFRRGDIGQCGWLEKIILIVGV